MWEVTGSGLGRLCFRENTIYSLVVVLIVYRQRLGGGTLVPIRSHRAPYSPQMAQRFSEAQEEVLEAAVVKASLRAPRE